MTTGTGPPRLTQDNRRSAAADRILSVSGAIWVTHTSTPASCPTAS